MISCPGTCGKLWHKKDLFHVQTHSRAKKHCTFKMCPPCWIFRRSEAKDRGSRFAYCSVCNGRYGAKLNKPKPKIIKPEEKHPISDPKISSTTEEYPNSQWIIPFIQAYEPPSPIGMMNIVEEMDWTTSMTTEQFIAYLERELTKFT